MSLTRTEIRVQWADADPAQIVWHGNFLRYLDQAEQDLFGALGLTYQSIDARFAVILPRTRFQCTFRSPARVGDHLVVELSVMVLHPRRIRVPFTITNRETERRVLEGDYEMACVARDTFAPSDFPPALFELFVRAQTPEAQVRGSAD
ncbi:MAG: thioesterase family protein [Acidobacteriota bacterium]